jgi:hypothetical protein
MQINPCCRRIGVSQRRLHQRDRGASLQRMRGMSVTQPMWRNRFSDSGSLRGCGHDASNLAPAQGSIFATSEHWIIGMGRFIDRLQLQSGFAANAEDSIPVEQIVTAIMKYNARAAKSNKPRIYISRTIAQEFAPHSAKEADEYFKENKKAIDAHNIKHDLKRHSNRDIKGQDWQSWIEV